MNELALFAGAGGGILGGHLLGWRTVCAVEWEAYPASVLVARQNDKVLSPFPIWDDVQTFAGKPWRGIIDVVSGGFPCQDISSAGKGVGITGARSSMWGHMARIIGEVRPQYAFVENSPMLTSRGLGTVLGDLSEMGYDAEWCVLGADDVGARHQRERIWIIAKDTKQSRLLSHSEHNGIGWRKQRSESIEKKTNVSNPNDQRREWVTTIQIDRCSGSINRKTNASNAEESTSLAEVSNVANSNLSGFSPCNQSTSRSKQQVLEREFRRSGNESREISNSNGIGQSRQGSYGKSISQEEIRNRQTSIIGPICESNFWSFEPNVGRVVDGMAGRVDRLKAIGNGQVPLCAATAWNILKGRIDDKNNAKLNP
jgi:DNA (cytosine-5)-methyltransferase 1